MTTRIGPFLVGGSMPLGHDGTLWVARSEDDGHEAILWTAPTLQGDMLKPGAQLPTRAQAMAHAEDGEVHAYRRGTCRDGRVWFAFPRFGEPPEIAEGEGGGGPLALETLQAATLAVHDAHEDGWRIEHPTVWEMLAFLERACRIVERAMKNNRLHGALRPGFILRDRMGRVHVFGYGISASLKRGVFTAKQGRSPGLGPPHYVSRSRWAHVDDPRPPVLMPQDDTGSLVEVLRFLMYGRPRRMGHLDEASADAAVGHTGPEIESLLAELKSFMVPRAPAHTASVPPVARYPWLQRTNQIQQAIQHLGEALELRADARAAWREVIQLRACEEPVSDARVRRARAEADRLELMALKALHSATAAAQLPDSRRLAAEIYLERLLRADAALDPDAARWEEELLARSKMSKYAAYLDGRAMLELTTKSRQVRVAGVEYRLSQRTMVPQVPMFQNMPSDAPLWLNHGSSLLTLSVGGEELRYPVWLTRCEKRTLRRPGDDQSFVLDVGALAREAREGRLRGDTIVPAGWFISGGDEDACDPTPRRQVWLDSYAIKTFPVTCSEYLEFVRALRALWRRKSTFAPLRRHFDVPGHSDTSHIVAMSDDELIDACLPVAHSEGGYPLAQYRWRRYRGRNWAVGTGSPDHPVIGITWVGARCFAAWRAWRERLPWRLPHGQEWEKAARGVDGRRWPWGNDFSPSMARMIESDEAQAALVSVHDQRYADDVSIYGMRGAAGNARDMCENLYRKVGLKGGGLAIPAVGPSDLDPNWRTVKGGSYLSSANFCGVASRFSVHEDEHVEAIGFRLARSL